MKQILILLLTLMLITVPALAEMDLAPLKEDPDWYAYPVPGSVNTVYRTVKPPFIGQTDEAFDGELVAWVDYITLVDAGSTVPRLVISTTVWDMPLNAQEVRLTVGKTRYSLAVTHTESEYDGMYMEDYEACLVGEGLSLLKAIAQQKNDTPIPVEVLAEGNTVFAGLVVIPGAEAAAIYDRYIDMGGKKQSLKPLEALWPCKAEKIK